MADSILVEKFMKNLSLVFETDTNSLTRETSLKDDLKISSTKRLMIIADIAELFGKEVPYETIFKCLTIGDLLDLLDTL